MTEISFTGSIGYITYLVEKYEKQGYEIVSYKPKNNPKFGQLISVKMEKPHNLIKMERIFEAVFTRTTLSDGSELTTATWATEEKPLSEQLTEAIEREDYETAAILRDKINSLG
jgi:hypothetical protein